MSYNQYALAVDIGNDSFEIFDILVFEKETEIDRRYSKNIDNRANAMYVGSLDNVAIGSIWNGTEFILPENTNAVNVNDGSKEMYVFLNNNIIFGFTAQAKNTYNDNKYKAAFDSNVIIVKAKDKKYFQLGDILHTDMI